MFATISRRIASWVSKKDRVYLLLGVLCLLGSVTLTAHALLTVSNSGLLGDGAVTIDGAGVLNLGTASSTAVVIGNSGIPVTIPGTLTLGSASSTGQLIFRNASTSFTTTLQASSSQASNLTLTLPPTLGTSAQAMLTDGTGNLYFGNVASSQWLSGASGTIYYNSGNVGINTSTPTALLSLVGSSSSPASLFNISSSSGASLFNVSGNGTVTVGTTVSLPAPTGGDDTARLQAAINSAAIVNMAAGTWHITTITLRSGVVLRGAMPSVAYSATVPPDFEYIPNGGTWLDCGYSICFTGTQLRSVGLESFGVQNFTKGFVLGASGVDGISLSWAQHIFAVGNLQAVNPSDTAWEVWNIEHFNTNDLECYHVQTGLHLTANLAAWNGANSDWQNFYVYAYPKAVSVGNASKNDILIEAAGQNLGSFNLSAQVNSYSGDGTNTKVKIIGSGGGIITHSNSFRFSSLEGPALNAVYCEYCQGVTIEIDGVDTSATTPHSLALGANSSNVNAISHSPVATASDLGANNFFYGVWATSGLRGFYFDSLLHQPYMGNQAASGPLLSSPISITYPATGPTGIAISTNVPANNSASAGVASAFSVAGNYWSGSASLPDKWVLAPAFTAAGANPDTNLNLTHSGSSGTATLQLGANIAFHHANGSGFSATGDWYNVGNFTQTGQAMSIKDSALNLGTNSVATSGANFAPSALRFDSVYWNGSVNTLDRWSIAPALAAGTNPIVTLVFSPGGSTGTHSVQVPRLKLAGTVAETCDSTARGNIQYTAGGTGVKDIVQVCAKDTSDVYAWRAIY